MVMYMNHVIMCIMDYSGNVYEPCYYVRNGLEW